ncbi:MAG: hypothetical protein ACD_39C02106G0002 [uncultured bacterium]|nr:MAG: hypothetical protein ACD_39C02106G0002 [uncultured bacterium]
MAEDFWAPVFERLLEDYGFLELVVNDTAESDLTSWIKPNRALFARCARFVKKNRVLDKPALAREMLAYSRNDAALRKIILFTWVEKNSVTMKFPTLPVTAESETQLQSGAFGSPAKIRILANLDPRDAMKSLYERVLAGFEAEFSAQAGFAVETGLAEINVAEQKLEQRVGELGKALENLREDNRQLKRQLEARQNEINAQSRRIEEYSRLLKAAEDVVQDLKGESAGLRSRLNFLESQSAQVQPAVERTSRSDESERLELLSQETSALRRAVENRETTIRRLESEKAELAARQAADTEKDRQIAALRQRLAEIEVTAKDHAMRLAGQLVSSHKEPCGKRNWLFLSISGRVIFVEGALVSRTALVSDEFCLLHLDADEKPVLLESLESDARREICGCVEASGDELFLLADSQRFKVQVEVGANLVGVAVRCVWLHEFAERPAGIYRIEALAQHERSVKVQKTADLKQIKAFFKVSHVNFDRFAGLLRQQEISFTSEPDGSLTFLADYHEVLEPVRMRTRVYRCCSRANCQKQVGAQAMVRQAMSGERCDFCSEIEAADVSVEQRQFSGQRVLIFGGDYVGSEYERVLSAHGLNVEWYSGFKNLAELKNGFGSPDLIVVVVRQISHTLLRELVAIIARDSLPVLYSSRRGITGILADLTRYFSCNCT